MYLVQIAFDDVEEAIDWLQDMVDKEVVGGGTIIDAIEGGEVAEVKGKTDAR